MEVKETVARILGRKTDIMTRDSIHKGSARSHRVGGSPGLLMPRRSVVFRLDDILETSTRVRETLGDFIN
jgi:hypothetical protein